MAKAAVSYFILLFGEFRFVMYRTPHTSRCGIASMLLLLGVTIMLSACGEPAQKKTDSRSPAEPAEVLIKFKTGIPEDSIRTLTARLGLEKTRELSAIGVRVYRTTSRVSVAQVLSACKSDSHLIEYAEPNIKYRIPEKNQN
jgi:hypothetical protein